MKSFRKIVSEVAQPKAGDEKNFKDKHIVTKVDYPVDVEDQFTGGKTVKKAPKRRADLEAGEDEKVYEAMDPVNKKAAMGKFKDRADKDINNDGKVDSTDRYLHARRKAITKAIHKEEAETVEAKSYGPGHIGAVQKMLDKEREAKKAKDAMKKEEVEELDEISRDTARSYIRQAAAAGGRKKGIEMAGKKAYSIGGEPKVRATEEVEQLDELSPNTLHSYIKKAAGNMAGNAAVGAAQASSSMKKSSPDVKRNIRNRMRGITGASGRLADKANMSENAWEEVPMMMRQLQFIAYAAEEIMDYLDMGVDPEEWYQNKLATMHDQMQTLHAYAEGEKRMMSRMDYNMYGEEADLDEAKTGDDAVWMVTWKQKNTGNDGREYMDSTQFHKTEREARLHKGKLKYDPRVLRNSPVMKKIKDRDLNQAKESFELEEATPTKKAITRALQGMKVQPKEKVTVKKAPWEKNEEADLDEAAPKIKPDFLKTQREKDRAHNAAMGRTPTGRKKTMTSTQRSMASMRNEEAVLDESITKMSHGRLKFHLNTSTPHGSYSNDEMKSERDRRLKSGEGEAYRKAKAGLSESIEMLDEAFKAGMVKLKDGGSVVLKKEDADLLNKMFKDLSSTNRKKMQEVAMKDKNGFDEILGFAREAI